MVRLSPDAVMDVRRLRAFLDARNPGVTQRALHEVFKTLTGLQTFPNMGRRTAEPEIRQINIKFGHSGYIARYTVEPNGDVVVTRIWHAREARPED